MNQAETLRQWKERQNIMGSGPAAQNSPMKFARSHFPKVLSFSSGKGGVGKTNVVTNTALALCKLGYRAMILDADLGLANVDVILGLAPKYSIKHVLSGERGISEIVLQGPKGVLILPASSGVPELANLNDAEKMFLLAEMDELASSIDLLLIDTSAGISDTVLYFNMAAQERVIVVTPEPTSITDAYALIKVLSHRHRIREFSILVNCVSGAQESHKVYKQLSAVADRFLGQLSLKYLGYIPRDEAVPKAVCNQRAVVEMFPTSDASKGFMTLAENLINKGRDSYVDGNIKFFWRHILKL